jgi:hypothetical protein
MLGYAVPLFVPPPAVRPAPLGRDADLLERLFPDVPPWWMVGRLVCLLGGAGLTVLAMRRTLPLRLDETMEPQAPNALAERVGAAQWVALLLALGLAVSALFVAGSSRFTQAVFFVCLATPAGVLGAVEAQGAWRVLRRSGPRLAILIVMPTLWLAWGIPAAWRSPRAATLVDMWVMMERLGATAFGDSTLLAETGIPGLTNTYLLLDGLVLGALGRPPLSFAQVQALHFFWTAVCALAIGVVVWRMVELRAAVVAQAVFLFSPLTMSFPYHPGPLYIMPLCVAGLLLLVLAVRDFRSTAALAAFGALAGFSVRIPQLAAVTVLLCAFMVVSVKRLPRIPWIAVGAAVLSGVAALAPSFPRVDTLMAMARETTFGQAQMAGILMILFGQRPVRRYVMAAGRPGLFDIPLGALLAPFGIARTPLRLLGDTLLDPMGTMLMASGLVVCAFQPTNRGVLLLLGLLASGMVTALASSGDVVSHTRLAPALLPMAVFSGLGFEALRRGLMPRWWPGAVAALTAAIIAGAGIALFDAVNPTILPASWQAVGLEALGACEPNADAIFLHYGLPWLQVEPIAALLPGRRLSTLTYEEFERTLSTAPTATMRTYIWNPGLEADSGLSCLICARWPGAEFFTLDDVAGVSHAFAAAPPGTWRPRLPPQRWRSSPCSPLCRSKGTAGFAVQTDVPQCGSVPEAAP